MKFSHILAAVSGACLMCFTTGTAGAQPADSGRDVRSILGTDAKPADPTRGTKPRPDASAKPADAGQDARPRLDTGAKPTDAARDTQSRPGVKKRLGSEPTLTVRKILIPSGDSGRFNLIVDGVVKAYSVGNNGTTGPIVVLDSSHTVTEAAGAGGTDIANYITTKGGDCSPSGVVVLAAGQSKTCTITNSRKIIGPGTSAGEGNKLTAHLLPEWTHGTWTQGPGTYSFKVCAHDTTCNISGAPYESIPITIQIWGGGGGGAGGNPSHGSGGEGGGGGAGGSYSKMIITAVVPSSGALVYYVSVGAGGAKGQTPWGNGGMGAATQVSGPFLFKITGGLGGSGYTGGAGTGQITNDYPGGGANTTTSSGGGNGGTGNACNGYAGGGGGNSAGPGNANYGGAGGHGGYFHHKLFPTCTDAGPEYELSDGKDGAGGKVTFAW